MQSAEPGWVIQAPSVKGAGSCLTHVRWYDADECFLGEDVLGEAEVTTLHDSRAAFVSVSVEYVPPAIS